jgi:hypothetical protein
MTPIMRREDGHSSTSMEARPARTLEIGGAVVGAGAMLFACRLAGLFALVFDYAVGGAGGIIRLEPASIRLFRPQGQ